MNHSVYVVDTLPEFSKEAKRFVAKKRFFSLPEQIENLKELLAEGKFEGELVRRGENPNYEVYKLRLPNPDANVGKSGGYRVYYVVVSEHRTIILMCIYYKKEYADMPDAYIDGLIDGCILDLLPDEDDKE